MYNKQTLKKGIIGALCYSDIFDYPLKLGEIHRYYIGKDKVGLQNIKQELASLVAKNVIGRKNGYYFLNGRSEIVDIRLERKKISTAKIKLAQKVASYLGEIPTLKFIGLSGSLSTENSNVGDDIDLFFITNKNTLWITRLLINIMLLLRGHKRSRKDNLGVDKICPNMFLAEDNLKISNIRQNLFSAREIVQLRPLLNKDNVYEEFINENNWVSNFIPNSYYPNFNNSKKSNYNFATSIVNNMLYLMQHAYMMGRITNEEISLKKARFHPCDYSSYVLDIFELKFNGFLRQYKEEVHANVSNKTTDTPGY